MADVGRDESELEWKFVDSQLKFVDSQLVITLMAFMFVCVCF